MPPLGFQKYEHVKTGTVREALQIEADAGYKVNKFLRKRREEEGSLSHSFKLTRPKGYASPKAIYASPTAEQGQRITAWVVEHGLSVGSPSEIYIQAQKREDDDWKDLNKPTCMAKVGQIWGEVEYTFVDPSTLTEEARLKLAHDLDQTVDAIIAAGSQQ